MMKKLLVLLCVGAMLLGFTACGHDCDVCGNSGAEEFDIFGETIYLCDDCQSF